MRVSSFAYERCDLLEIPYLCKVTNTYLKKMFGVEDVVIC